MKYDTGADARKAAQEMCDLLNSAIRQAGRRMARFELWHNEDFDCWAVREYNYQSNAWQMPAVEFDYGECRGKLPSAPEHDHRCTECENCVKSRLSPRGWRCTLHDRLIRREEERRECNDFIQKEG